MNNSNGIKRSCMNGLLCAYVFFFLLRRKIRKSIPLEFDKSYNEKYRASIGGTNVCRIMNEKLREYVVIELWTLSITRILPPLAKSIHSFRPWCAAHLFLVFVHLHLYPMPCHAMPFYFPLTAYFAFCRETEREGEREFRPCQIKESGLFAFLLLSWELTIFIVKNDDDNVEFQWK